MKSLLSIMLLWSLCNPVQAADLETEIAQLAQAWDRANFQLEGERKEEALSELAKRAEALTSRWPGRAEPLVWEGIVLSSWAGAKGGLGALGLVDRAREKLETAESIDPAVLNGSVYTSLGSLYYQVPGWPLGFGDDDKAREYLEKALAINPDGIDSNYFYGDFLMEEGHYRGAVEAFERALRSAPRPGREVADAGRRAQIENALARARARASEATGNAH